MHQQRALWGALLVCSALLNGYSTSAARHHQLTEDFALELHDGGDVSLAKEIAEAHGFDLLWHAPQLGNVYYLRHRTACKAAVTPPASDEADKCSREAADLAAALRSHPRVLRAVHQVAEELDRKWLASPDEDSDLGASEEVVDVKDEDTDDEAERLERKTKGQEEAAEEEDAHAYKKALSQRKLLLKFNDPHFGLQWYLQNVGQFNGINPGLDLNLVPAWNKGFDGSGVVVTVVDDGVDPKNPDLKRLDILASADLNNLSNTNGLPIRFGRLSSKESHGTACGGEIGAAANNSFCGVGVAFNVSLGGIRILDGVVTDLLEAYAILHNNQYIHIYSCSWGPKDNGFKMDMPKGYSTRALRLGVMGGRGRKGSIYVMASGNGGTHGDNCGADGFVNSPYTIAVAALNIYGQTPMYGESCSAIHVAVPVGGRDSAARGSPRPDPQVTTTMVNGGCFNRMSGTSAATPLVSACIALALQANPRLTWRDVQHLLARSARLPSATATGWQVNGAGRLVSHHAGFGLLDCARLVFNAQTWPGVAKQAECADTKPFKGKFPVPAGKPLTLAFSTSGCGGAVSRLEHVLLTLTMGGGMRRGDIELWLESPTGLRARLLAPRPRDNDRKDGIRAQTFLSLLSWDENPAGRWLLRVRDRSGRSGAFVAAATLRFTGTGGGASSAGGAARARWLSQAEVAAEFRKQRMESAGQQVLHPTVAAMSERLAEALGKEEAEAPVGRLQQLVGEARDLVKRMGQSGVTEWDLRYLLGQIDTALRR